MFEYITGTLTLASPQKAILDVEGLGYCIHISIRTFEHLPKLGAKTRLFISTIYREDSQKMYGFIHPDEKKLFESLIDISGIGPRLALSLLGHLSVDDLYLAVEQGQAKVLSRVPGIGKKMAERLILELKDKLHKLDKQPFSTASAPAQGVVVDAINALIHLGYNPLEAQKAVKSVLPADGKEPLLPELISLALKSKK